MLVFREDTIRQMYIKGGEKVIYVPKGSYVTKEAEDYVRDHHLHFEYETEPTSNEGEECGTKPEHLTHLFGNHLVPKNHLRIVLRGKLDSLQAQIIEVQVTLNSLELYDLRDDLQSALVYVRKIMASEVKNLPLAKMQLFSMGVDEVKNRSHNPKKYYNVGHVVPSHAMGEVVAKLNLLRTSVREVEIAAVSAFLKGTVLEHEDIVLALNRLSSGFYILMLQFMSEDFYDSSIKEWGGIWL